MFSSLTFSVLVSRVLVLLFSGILFFAFPPSLLASEKIVLRVQGLPDPSSAAPEAIARRRVITEFCRLNPHVELTSVEGLRIPNLVSESVTIMMVLGGTAPDVIRMNFRSIDSFVRQGIVAPLDELIAGEPDGGKALMEGIPSQIKPVIKRPSPLKEDRNFIYGLPGDILVIGLFYNRELFREVGLPDRGPRDWDELRDFANRVSAKSPEYHGIMLATGANASWSLINFLWSAGGDAVKEVGPDKWQAVFNTPEAVEAYRFYYQLTEVDRSAIRTNMSPTSSVGKRSGMMLAYVGSSTVNVDSDAWGVSAMPLGPSGQRGSEINAPLYGIYSGIEDPRIKKAAYDYISFITGPEAERLKVQTYVDLGQGASVNPVLLKKYGFHDSLALTPPGLVEEYEEAMKNGKPEPYGKNCTLVYKEMTDPLDKILLSRSIAAHWKAGDQEAVRREIGQILDTAVARTNERMLEYVPPEEMRIRRIVGAVVAAASILGFVGVIAYVFKAFSRTADMTSRPVRSRSFLPWLFLAPALGLILVWSYLPVASGTVIAFLKFNVLLESTFVGLDNFANALFDQTFWNAMFATLHYAGWTLTLGFAAPILLSYVLHLIPKQKVFFRTLYYLPSVISGTAVFFLWFELFSANGIFNQALAWMGIESVRAWTEEPRLAMLTCILPSLWAGTGPGCLIYLAALKTIPEEQFEAAEIDGAGFLNKTRNVVFPGLKALILINFVGAIAAAFHSSGNILIMTGGGPNGMTEVMSLFIFFEAFTRLRMGPATAMAWILASMLIGVTVLQLKRLSQVEFKGGR